MLNTPTKKLVSLLTAATVTAGVISAPMAYGLGLGKPAVESHIGEPLRVRIPVSVVSESELEALQVRIAGSDWYRQAGIDRDPVVDTLLVGVERSAGGANVVITSADGLNQVMLPLLLEVSGPRMTLRKQVSVLLSPALANQADDPWQDPRVEVSGVIGADTSQSVVSTKVESPVARETYTDSIELSGETGPASEVVDAGIGSNTDAAWPTTVRVQPGDSLSSIVNDLLPTGATRFQGRIAFYDRNPEAFHQGDIHRLKADVVMVVPSPVEILAVSRGEALARYQALTPPLTSVEPQLQADTSGALSEPAYPPEVADSGVSVTTVPENASQGNSAAGFKLSLHDAPMELLPDALPADESPMVEATPLTDRVGDGGLVTDESLLLSDSAQAPRMQGFSLRMDALNAYIIELQDENRFLKQRVDVLEGSVDRLNSELASLNTRLLTFQTRIGDAPVPAIGTMEDPELSASDFTEYNGENDLVYDWSGESVVTGTAVDSDPGSDVANEPEITGESNDVPAEAVEVSDVSPAATATTAVSTSSGISRVVMGEDLVSIGRRYLDFASQPIVRLIGGVVILSLLLMAWMMRSSRREKELLGERGQQRFDQLDLDDSKGVSFSADPESAIDPDDSEGLLAQPGLTLETDSLQDSDVDLITQAEVYLKYHRPSQAVQALREEYGKPDSDKFVVAMRLVDVFKEIGGTEERNNALGSFISRVNEDIDLFSDEQWINLRAALDDMRRGEQDSALNMDRKPGESAEVLEPEIEAWERLGKL